MIIHLIGKGKIDKRTYRNLKAIFGFIGKCEEFTGPQIQKNLGLKGSVLYDLLGALERKRLIEEAGRIKSTGRGETRVYRLTLVGKMVASYVNDDMDLLVSALKQIAEKTTNPIKRFIIEAFIKNYPSSMMREILEASIIKTVGAEEEFDIIDLLSNVFEGALIMFPLLEDGDNEIVQIFRKNAELMENTPLRKWFFLYVKTQLESFYLYHLEGEKIAKYIKSLAQNPDLFNVPCRSPECTNVITASSLLEISIPPYCEECKKRMPTKA
ncbi:MAG: hypothetical protein QXX56_05060 [Candidatus Bathyarchaeia archaeon]